MAYRPKLAYCLFYNKVLLVRQKNEHVCLCMGASVLQEPRERVTIGTIWPTKLTMYHIAFTENVC